jgi:hypothetical protein
MSNLPCRILACWLSLLAIATALGAEPPPLGTEEILNRFLERSRGTPDRIAAQHHACVRTTTTEELGSDGRVKERKSREFEVELIGAKQKLRLLRVDGRLPNDRESRRETTRETEMKKKYGERQDKARSQGPDFIDERIVQRYHFATNGVELIHGRPAYLLRFSPKPGLEVKETADRALNRLTGRIWIDAEEFELVKLDAHLEQPLSLVGGIVATVERMEFDLERERHADGFWFNTHFSSLAIGRKLFTGFHVRTRIDQDHFRAVTTPSRGSGDRRDTAVDQPTP